MGKSVVTCPKCLTAYRVADGDLGRTGHCRKCTTSFVLTTEPDVATRTFAYCPDGPDRDEVLQETVDTDSTEVLAVGDVLLDVYEVKRLDAAADSTKHYAEGGMGVVYRVHHRGWDLDLAVKTPKQASLETEQGKRDFERECNTWIELGLHPNIVSCYYVRRVGGIPRLFAEFVEGGSLEDWIRTRRLHEGGAKKSLTRILDIAIQFAWGLHYAHEMGLIHQDVKPGNVMMQGLVPKVTDFGLAKARVAAARLSPDATQVSMAVSWGGMTPAYCSPEQIEAAVQTESGVDESERTKLTRQTDIWSWALTLFAMFCGKAPCRYGGHTAPKVFEAYIQREPEDESLPRVPRSLARLLGRCFSLDPAQRPRTMNEVAEAVIEVYREVTGNAYPRQEPVIGELLANSLNNRAASLMDLGRQEEAADLLEEAWQQHPWLSQVTYNRGVLRWRHGKVTDAELVSELEELCLTRTQDWNAAYALGLVQLERGEVKLAIKALGQALALGGGVEVQATLEEAESLLPEAPRCIRSFTGRSPYVTQVFLSADNRWAVSGIDETKLRVWDLASGRSALTFDTPGKRASRTADGRWELSVGKGNTYVLTDLLTEGRRQTFHPITWGSPPSAGSFSPDRRLTLHGGDHYSFELHDAQTGQRVRSFRGHTGPVRSVLLSADGELLLSGSADKTLRLWETATGRCLRTLKGHTDPVNTVFLVGNAQWALSASTGRRLRLWNLERIGNPEQRFTAPILLCHVTSAEEAGRAQARFGDLCGSARAAITGGRYDDALELVRAARGLSGYGVARESLDLWARVGRRCTRVRASDAWCVHTMDGHSGDVRSVAFSIDSKWGLSASSDGTLRVWNLATGKCMQTLAGHTDWVTSACFLPDGRSALSGSWDRTLRLWSLGKGKCVRTFGGHKNYVGAVAVASDGRFAYSGSWDRTLRLWNVATGECLKAFQGHEKYVNSICPSGDTRTVLSGSEDHTLRLWSVASGETLRVLRGHTDWVQAVAMSPDGTWALSASKDRTLRLWDLPGGTCQRVLEGHTGPVTAVSLSADGRWALSASKDKTLRLWELAAGTCRHVFEGHTGPISSVSLSADGRWALSGAEDNSVRLWEIDWDFRFPGWSDWDERARPYLQAFLTLRCPVADDGLTRTGQPRWDHAAFQKLLAELRRRGLGWLRPEGVRRVLERMTAEWHGPAPLPES